MTKLFSIEGIFHSKKNLVLHHCDRNVLLDFSLPHSIPFRGYHFKFPQYLPAGVVVHVDACADAGTDALAEAFEITIAIAIAVVGQFVTVGDVTSEQDMVLLVKLTRMKVRLCAVNPRHHRRYRFWSYAIQVSRHLLLPHWLCRLVI